MTRPEFKIKCSRKAKPSLTIAALAIITLMAVTTISMQAQTFTVLHNFTNGGDGSGPYGLAMDRAGNLYGTTAGPGDCYTGGCGAVYKLAHSKSSWVFSQLYRFQGGTDGRWPHAGVTVAADGSLYGTTTAGGGGPCALGDVPGCGTVYRLRPPPTRCASATCFWDETILHTFASDPIWYPYAEVTFDAAGNLYGTAVGGSKYPGGVFELTPAQGGWTYSILHIFTGIPDGAEPYGAVMLDQSGNIFGTTLEGGSQDGTAFEVSPSGSGWTEKVLYSFSDQNNNGTFPPVGLIEDRAGNLYGVTDEGGPTGGGTVFELSPSNGGYSISVLYDGFVDLYGEGGGASSKLVMDPAGNLYGATAVGGANLQGMVFKLSPGENGWTFADLHDFDYTDGANPGGNLVLDASGNLYGAAAAGGANGYGSVWEITP